MSATMMMIVPVPILNRNTPKAVNQWLKEIIEVAQKHALAVDDFAKTFDFDEAKSRTLKENYKLINSIRAQHVAPLRSFLWIHGPTQLTFDKIEKRHDRQEQIRSCNKELRVIFDSMCEKIEPLYKKIDEVGLKARKVY
ncbi:MAG: hypothetical protein KKE83_11850 [Proteobacteria bacterium]|nr:hypothetical protein [Pseudomonadota bacterium]MBU1547012.1 hypothetical protein [Pseudomonadota bacterium]MBU2620365.1 hypothetical protein [Pseudomonadota bacterium]